MILTPDQVQEIEKVVGLPLEDIEHNLHNVISIVGTGTGRAIRKSEITLEEVNAMLSASQRMNAYLKKLQQSVLLSGKGALQ